MSDQSQRQYEAVAVGAGILALLALLSLRHTPRWVRIVVVAALTGLSCGAAVLGYRYYSKPTTLTVATGSLDGELTKLMTAIASRLAANSAPVRLKVVPQPSVVQAAEVFAKGQTDLAVVRADVGDLTNGRAIIIVGHSVALLLTPSGSGVQGIDDLKGKMVGVVGLPINQEMVQAISKQYDLERNKTQFRNVMPDDVLPALTGKQVQALLLVMPISQKYISRVREVLLRNPKLKVTLLPIESAGAIAAINGAYESFDVPKGTIRGSPPIPDDDLTTLRLPFYLVAQKTLDDDVAGALAQAIFEARNDLTHQFPLLTQIAEPDKDNDAFVPVHPGADAYFSGDQKSFFDKHGDQIFYGSLFLGSLTSFFAGAWRFMTRKADAEATPPLTRLFAMMKDIRGAKSEAELADAEARIDRILEDELDSQVQDEADASNTLALSLATHRLERLLEQRRTELAGPRNEAPA